MRTQNDITADAVNDVTPCGVNDVAFGKQCGFANDIALRVNLCYNTIKVVKTTMYKSKMMIVIRRDLRMRKGKIAAQAGHACIDAILMALNKEGRLNDFEMTVDGLTLENTDKPSSPLSDWFTYGCAKVCVCVDSEDALLEIAQKAKEKGIIASVIVDAGKTEFHGVPTKTCLALEPLPAEIADELTGDLPLY